MLPRTISEITNGIWLIDPSRADGYLPLVASLLDGSFDRNKYSIEEREKKYSISSAVTKGVHKVSDYGQANPPESAPENSVAIIGIQDVITKYDQECGSAGMMTKADLIRRCEANPNIIAGVLCIDSPGGESTGMFHLIDALQNTQKPWVCFIDDLGASAAYGIASSAFKVIASSNICEVGSIGTYCTLFDYTERLKMLGVKKIEVYADASTEKNKPYKDALKGNTKLLKDEVNRVNDEFINMVKVNRSGKLNTSENDPFKGKLFFAEDAIQIGLIDEIGGIERAIEIAKESGLKHANS